MNERLDLTAGVDTSRPADRLLEATLPFPNGTCAIDVAREAGHEEIAVRLERHSRGD